MTIKPVETAPRPEYPDKYSIEAAKAIQTARSYRWLTVPLAGGILTASILMGLSGCGNVFGTDGLPVVTPAPGGQDYFIAGTPAPIPYDDTIQGDMVAVPTPYNFGHIPLFEFGAGTGSLGCVMVTAPVFLSEDEAFAILSAAFEEAGLTLDKGSDTLYGINRPVTDLNDWQSEILQTVSGPLSSDGTLQLEDGLPMVFVSKEDLDAWQYVPQEGETVVVTSVSSYNMKKAAQVLADNNSGLLVFYDPSAQPDAEGLWELKQEEGESDEAYHARWDAIRSDAEQTARAESEQLLRAQAEAFLQWLRAEGII